jgi:hypothetical protein
MTSVPHFEVSDGGFDSLDVVIKAPKASIAVRTEQATVALFSMMVVIYRQMVRFGVTLWARLLAYGTDPTLIGQKFQVLGLINAVQFFLHRKAAMALIVRLVVALEAICIMASATARGFIISAPSCFLAAELGERFRFPTAHANLFPVVNGGGGWAGYEMATD